MIFIAIRKHRALPKGVLTPKKSERLIGVRNAFNRRANKIQSRFLQLSQAKELLKKIDESAKKVRELAGDPHYYKERITAVAENCLFALQFVKQFKAFAIAENANPIQLKKIENQLKTLEEATNKIKRML